MKNYISYFIISILTFSCQTEGNTSEMSELYCPSSIESSSFHMGIDESLIIRNENLPCLIDKIQKDNLKSFDSVNNIPHFISEFIIRITNKSFWLANPNEPWQVGCIPPIEFDTINKTTDIDKDGNQILKVNILDKKYPTKQLVHFSLGKSTAILTYRSGGFGSMNHVLLFEYKKDKVLDFWCYNPDSQSALNGDVIKYIPTYFDQNEPLYSTNINI